MYHDHLDCLRPTIDEREAMKVFLVDLHQRLAHLCYICVRVDNAYRVYMVH